MIRLPRFLKHLSMICLLSVGWASANASPIGLGSSYTDNVVVMPSSYQVTDFISSVAGTVRLTVTDLNWGDLLSTLSTSVSLFNGQRLQLEGSSSVVFDVGASERFTTSIYTATNGTRGYGLYQLSLAFTPSVTAVPLPLGGWMLLLGVSLLSTRIRRTRPLPSATA